MTDRIEIFVNNIAELNRCLQRIKEEEMRKLGLRTGHAMCLYQLGWHPDGLTVSQLTSLCHEDKAAISRSLTALTECGLVMRDTGSGVRVYRVPYVLTDEGRRTVRRFNARVSVALRHGSANLSDREREIMFRSIETVIRNLSAYVECTVSEPGKNESEKTN